MNMFTCPVCGYAELEDIPWDDEYTPSFTICDCCGVEFGYEDATQEGKLKYRKQWIASGGKWFNPAKKPENWNMNDQLKKIGINL
jgi:transcription elongation factor Elf1